MVQGIKRRISLAVGAAACALTIAACAGQANVENQPTLNQLMAPNGMVIQQPAQQQVQLNQLDAATRLTFDAVELAPVMDRGGMIKNAFDAPQNNALKTYNALEMGCGGK